MKQFITKLEPHNVFVALALIFGLFWLIIIPPFQTPDEDAHFFRAFSIAQGNITGVNYIQMLGDYIDQNIITFEKIFDKDTNKYHVSIFEFWSMFKDSLKIKLCSNKENFVSFYNTCLYTPILYLPQCIGINLARVGNMPPILIYYCGKLFSFIDYIILGYLALRIIPIFKLTTLTILLLPMVLHLAGSFSADTLLNLISLIYVAIILNHNYYSKKIISNFELAILYVLSTAITLSKNAYLPFVFLYFLIPQEKFNNTKNYYYHALAIIATNIIALTLWTLAFKNLHINFDSNISPQDQFMQIINQPYHFIKLLANTITSHELNDRLFTLGWFNIPLPLNIRKYYYILYLIPLFEKNNISNKIKGLITLLVVTLIVLLINIGLYSTWPQPQDEHIINGVQTRYFIPLLLPLLLALNIFNPLKYFNTNYKLTLIYSIILFFQLWQTTQTIFKAFYNIG